MQDARTCNALRIPNSNRAEWGYGPNHAAPKPTAKLELIKVCIISRIKPRTHNAQIMVVLNWVDLPHTNVRPSAPLFQSLEGRSRRVCRWGAQACALLAWGDGCANSSVSRPLAEDECRPDPPAVGFCIAPPWLSGPGGFGPVRT